MPGFHRLLGLSGQSEGYVGPTHEFRICVRLPDPDSAICATAVGYRSVVLPPGEDSAVQIREQNVAVRRVDHH
jgi:hypothetical protein